MLVDGHVGFAGAHAGMSNAFAAAGCDLVERHPVEPNRVSPRGHRGVFARTRLADQRNVDVQGDLTTDERWNGDEVWRAGHYPGEHNSEYRPGGCPKGASEELNVAQFWP